MPALTRSNLAQIMIPVCRDHGAVCFNQHVDTFRTRQINPIAGITAHFLMADHPESEAAGVDCSAVAENQLNQCVF